MPDDFTAPGGWPLSSRPAASAAAAVAAVIAAALSAPTSSAATPVPTPPHSWPDGGGGATVVPPGVSFARDVHPLLVAGCQRCHRSRTAQAGNTALLLTADAAADFADARPIRRRRQPAGSRLLGKGAGQGPRRRRHLRRRDTRVPDDPRPGLSRGARHERTASRQRHETSRDRLGGGDRRGGAGGLRRAGEGEAAAGHHHRPARGRVGADHPDRCRRPSTAKDNDGYTWESDDPPSPPSTRWAGSRAWRPGRPPITATGTDDQARGPARPVVVPSDPRGGALPDGGVIPAASESRSTRPG